MWQKDIDEMIGGLNEELRRRITACVQDCGGRIETDTCLTTRLDMDDFVIKLYIIDLHMVEGNDLAIATMEDMDGDRADWDLTNFDTGELIKIYDNL